MSLFGPELLKRFHYLSLIAARMGESPLLTTRQKRLPAGGTEVTGFRDYSPGDNFYHVYWTWCARGDELLVKVFEREPDRHVHLLLDGSSSMGLGRPAKFHLARQIAAALGYVSLVNSHRVDVGAMIGDSVSQLPPLGHVSQLPQLLRFLERLEPGDTRVDLARGVEIFLRRRPRPGPVVVLSDLYDPAGYQRALEMLRYQGYEPRLVQIFDRRENDPQLLGDVELFDAQTQTVRQVTITERTARLYRELMLKFHASVRDFCSRHGIYHIPLACDMPEEDVLLRVLGAKRDGRIEKPRPATSIP